MPDSARPDLYWQWAAIGGFLRFQGAALIRQLHRMSEYPRTGMNKAALKFANQGRKISQIVSVTISLFFPNFLM
jgi:hypothetical protein